jgi:hypothetical protein
VPSGEHQGEHLFDDGVGDPSFDQELAAAQEAQAAGDLPRARALLDRAFAHAPADQRARNLLGLTLFKLGELEKAEGIYRGLIDDHPADPTLRVNLGLVYLKKGTSAEAVRCFSTALDLQPDHVKAQNYLGLALAQKGDHAKARDWFVRSGNNPMAERMTGLINAAVARENARESAPPPPAPPSMPPLPTPAPSHPPAPVPATPGQTPAPLHPTARPPMPAPRRPIPEAMVTSQFAIPVKTSGETGEFAKLPPIASRAAAGGLGDGDEDSAETAEFSRSPLAPQQPQIPVVQRTATGPKLPPLRLPSWPPEPSGSSIPGSSDAMQRAFEAPPRDDVNDTDPSMQPLSVQQLRSDPPLPVPEKPTGKVTVIPIAPAPESVLRTLPGAHPSAPQPAVPPAPILPPAPPAAPIAPPQLTNAPPFVSAPPAAMPIPPAVASSPPAQFGSSSGLPRPTEPTALASYTSQRRLEVPAAESSFAIGSSELVIQVRGEMLTRLDGLVASWGMASVRSELKRFRGKATDKPFGDGARRMLRVSGEGRYVIARDGRCFTPLELGDEPAYFREEVLFAFEESLVFENGRVPSKLGGDLHLVHLRGRGRLLLVSGGEPRAVEVRKGEPLRIPMDQLVGWHGPLIQPRVVPIVEEAPELGIALELSGEGRALVDAPDGK